MQPDRAARLLEALDIIGDRIDQVRLVRVFQGEKGPHGAVSRGEFHYVIDRVAGAQRRGVATTAVAVAASAAVVAAAAAVVAAAVAVAAAAAVGGGFGGRGDRDKPRGLGSLKIGAPKEEKKEDDRPGRGEMPRAGIGWQLTAAPRDFGGGGRGGPRWSARSRWPAWSGRRSPRSRWSAAAAAWSGWSGGGSAVPAVPVAAVARAVRWSGRRRWRPRWSGWSRRRAVAASAVPVAGLRGRAVRAVRVRRAAPDRAGRCAGEAAPAAAAPRPRWPAAAAAQPSARASRSAPMQMAWDPTESLGSRASRQAPGRAPGADVNTDAGFAVEARRPPRRSKPAQAPTETRYEVTRSHEKLWARCWCRGSIFVLEAPCLVD